MEELQEGLVFRLATIKHDFPPNAPTLRFWHFEVSENDRAHAARTGQPPRLSVFDFERTTIGQAVRSGAWRGNLRHLGSGSRRSGPSRYLAGSPYASSEIL